jgi:hypothetical protein
MAPHLGSLMPQESESCEGRAKLGKDLVPPLRNKVAMRLDRNGCTYRYEVVIIHEMQTGQKLSELRKRSFVIIEECCGLPRLLRWGSIPGLYASFAIQSECCR